MGDFENIEQRLRGDALDAIIADFAAHAFQRQPPWINILHSYFGLRFLQFTEPRHNGALAIIVFGLDPTGKPKAATFPAHQVDLASKAAGLMQLRLLKIDSPELAQFAAQLPVGKIYASGHGFVPQVRTDIYDRLLQFADPAPAPGLPATWDDIDVGHLVIARDELAAGWWEAIVIARDGDMLTLKWRDYPKQAPAVLHRAALALLRPTAA